MTGEGEYVLSPGVNLFPEITMLANDSPNPDRKSLFVRFIKDQIDFDMVQNWLTACKAWHGGACDKSAMLGDTDEVPSLDKPNFHLVDVVDNCVVSGPVNAKYVALSYVWGNVDRDAILQLRKDNAVSLQNQELFYNPKTSTESLLQFAMPCK